MGSEMCIRDRNYIKDECGERNRRRPEKVFIRFRICGTPFQAHLCRWEHCTDPLAFPEGIYRSVASTDAPSGGNTRVDFAWDGAFAVTASAYDMAWKISWEKIETVSGDQQKGGGAGT